MSLPLKLRRAHFLVRPWLSLVLLDTPVNKETQTLLNVMEKEVTSRFIHRWPETLIPLLNHATQETEVLPDRSEKGSKTLRKPNWPLNPEGSVNIYI